MSILEIFCDVDDFMLVFDQWLKEHALTEAPSPRGRKANLSMSEVMTIMIWFHQSHYRDFKTFYLNHVCQYMRSEFPKLVSYSRFVDLIPGTLLPICVYMYLTRWRQTGIAFVDSTPISVCHNKRIRRHKTFAGLAHRGKSTMGWSMASNCTWWSMTKAKFWLSASPPAMSMTANRFQPWPASYGANWSVIKGTFPKTFLNSSLPKTSN